MVRLLRLNPQRIAEGRLLLDTQAINGGVTRELPLRSDCRQSEWLEAGGLVRHDTGNRFTV
jgi:hypothetical protein